MINSLSQIDKENLSEPDLADTFNRLIAYIRKLYSENSERKYNRHNDELFSKLEWQFETNGGNITYNIFESGVALIDRFILEKFTDLKTVGNYSFLYIFGFFFYHFDLEGNLKNFHGQIYQDFNIFSFSSSIFRFGRMYF